MQRTLLFTALALGLSSANPHVARGSLSEWAPPGPDDFRGPCPMMNTLANHGFLQHDGRNITREVVISAMGNALNFDEALANVMFEQAIGVNPEPNATYFTLDNLNRHNVLEHDASLSRTDAFFGNNHVFNQTIFDETKLYWTGPTLDANMLANGKIARQISSKAFNPTYRFTSVTEQFSLGEVAAPVIAFGDVYDITVDRALVEYFFENERLPTELGWSTKTTVVKLEDILRVSGAISNATSLITTDDPTNTTTRRLRPDDNGFVESSASALASPDIICHLGATNGLLVAPVTAGSDVALTWSDWAESHHGPAVDYMASCGGDCTAVDKNTLKWFKVAEMGQLELGTGSGSPGKWADDILFENNLTWIVTIPKELKPGGYVLRHELIALHPGGAENSTQMYP
ncbi:glycosyl hydrolase family 61-domain-containing protein [Hypoxylon crocopeplum]|nr:glycosyl hydrolase family 61-domain-containing protein [Hypoxylon crocopeplum]